MDKYKDRLIERKPKCRRMFINIVEKFIDGIYIVGRK